MAWDYTNHPFKADPSKGGIYCAECGGTEAGAQHTGRRAREFRYAETVARLAELQRLYGDPGEYPWETTLTDEETHDARQE